MIVLEFLGQILKKIAITLQILRLKLKTLNQTCTSSKSIMQLPNTVSLDSAIFIEIKRWGLNCGEKVKFCGEK
jgi:hypothetical protein